MIDRDHALPVRRQAELVGIGRGQVYYLSRATPDSDQQLMKRIDAIHLEHPFAGSRMLRDLLAGLTRGSHETVQKKDFEAFFSGASFTLRATTIFEYRAIRGSPFDEALSRDRT